MFRFMNRFRSHPQTNPIPTPCPYSQDELLILWNKFCHDTDVDANNCLTAAFLDFPAGTEKFEVWNWFDENLEGGIISQMSMDENTSLWG